MPTAEAPPLPEPVPDLTEAPPIPWRTCRCRRPCRARRRRSTARRRRGPPWPRCSRRRPRWHPGGTDGRAGAGRPAPAAAGAPPASYVARLFAALERHKTYPQEARFRRAQGVALLHFRMRRDGTVIGYRLERSAGDAALDGAVLAMIERASPLPAPPAEVAGDPIELTVPVRFALR